MDKCNINFKNIYKIEKCVLGTKDHWLVLVKDIILEMGALLAKLNRLVGN